MFILGKDQDTEAVNLSLSVFEFEKMILLNVGMCCPALWIAFFSLTRLVVTSNKGLIFAVSLSLNKVLKTQEARRVGCGVFVNPVMMDALAK